MRGVIAVGILESLWKPKVIENFVVHSICFNGQKMIVKLKGTSELEIEKNNIDFYIKERNTKQKLFLR